MSTVQLPSPEYRPRRKRRPRHSWSRRRRYLVFSILVCVLLLLVPVGQRYGWLTRNKGLPFFTPSTPSNLVVSKASLEGEGAGRCIRGTVRNVSRRRYDDIELRFTIRGATGTPLGTAVATIKTVESEGSAPFETVVPEATAMQFLRSITGTPR